jgi:hypothetical protein
VTAPVAAPVPAWVPVSSAICCVACLSGERMLIVSAANPSSLSASMALRATSRSSKTPTTVQPLVVFVMVI